MTTEMEKLVKDIKKFAWKNTPDRVMSGSRIRIAEAVSMFFGTRLFSGWTRAELDFAENKAINELFEENSK